MMPGMMVRRAAIERAGFYDPSIRHCEDLDLWLRLLKSGGRIIYHRRILYHLRSREDSLSKQEILMYESLLRIYDQIERRFILTKEERTAVERACRHTTAALQLEIGKKAFARGDVTSAIRNISAANEHFHRWKLRFVLVLMKTMPGVLRGLRQMRARLARQS